MKTVHSDILKETSGIIVHGVNCIGTMGSGIALKIANRYPHVFWDYKKHQSEKGLKLGDIIVTEQSPTLIIVSGVTQQFYGRDRNFVYADYSAVRRVFEQVNALALLNNLAVKFPSIGAGLANGNWATVSEIIEQCLEPSLDITHFIFP